MAKHHTGIVWLICASGLLACFAPERNTSDTTAWDGSSEDAGAGEPESEGNASASPGSATDEGTSGAVGADGPVLVSSEPEDGATEAAVWNGFRLVFDRSIDVEDAVGYIVAQRVGGELVPIMPYHCSSTEPECLGGSLPSSFLDESSGQLRGGMQVTVTVLAGLEARDGEVTTSDQVVEFTTFEYEDEFLLTPGVVTGLGFDPGSSALFTNGSLDDGFEAEIQKIILADGVPAQPAVVGVIEENCMGLDVIAGTVVVPCSGSGTVLTFTGLNGAELVQSEAITATPPDLLYGTTSVTAAGTRRFFAGIVDPQIYMLDPGGQVALFHNGDGLWSDPYEITLAGATLADQDVLFASAGPDVFELAASDGSQIAKLPHRDYLDATDLAIDSKSRLWIGGYGGLSVYDTTTYELVAAREGIDASGFALREDGDTIHAYFVSLDLYYAPIGHVEIEL